MRTFVNNSVMGFRSGGAIHKPVPWRFESPSHTLNQTGLARATSGLQIRCAASQLISSDSAAALIGEDDFPFSALLRLVRQMRE